MAEQKHWANITELGFMWGIRFLFWFYRVFGPAVFSLVSYPVVAWYYLTNRTARESSRNFLTRAARLGASGISEPVSQKHIFRHMREFARSTVDKLGVWTNSDLLDRVDFPGRSQLVEHLNRGEGVVLMGAHLGNMEICRSLSRINDQLKLNILVHTAHADKFNRLLSELELNQELELIEVDSISPATAIRLTNAIDRGEFVAILADRVSVSSRDRKQELSFLEAFAPFPEGPHILASILGCPVYALFCVRKGSRYKVECEKLAESIELPRSQREKALQDNMKNYVRTLEKFTLENPFQWFNFYPYWPES